MVDPKSYELAEYFLADEEILFARVTTMALAQAIQDVVEDWLREAREEGHIRERSSWRTGGTES
jgi:hypothetical protein